MPTMGVRTIFQSTPPRREVTSAEYEGYWPLPISIHTSPKGGDAGSGSGGAWVPISIHTSPKGGDVRVQRERIGGRISIHTSPKGGDTFQRPRSRPTRDFNPHLPEGR